jgi:hypothetical protein
VLRQVHHAVGQQGQRPPFAPFGRWRAGGRHKKSLVSARQLAGTTRPGLLAQSRIQSLFNEAALGPVDRRFAEPEAGCHAVVVDPRICRQQDLHPLEPTGGNLAAARQDPQLLAFALVQVNPVLYIHRCPRSGWQQG